MNGHRGPFTFKITTYSVPLLGRNPGRLRRPVAQYGAVDPYLAQSIRGDGQFGGASGDRELVAELTVVVALVFGTGPDPLAALKTFRRIHSRES